ncbi:MAG: hypothetical protein KDJ52_35925, partial [Anaerolineae bacterium]|nr:hypothetical protein [Anaerolineae bacterium]
TPNHSHSLDYGIQRNAGVYPGPVRINIDGTNYTTALGGPWGSAGASSGDVALEIADGLNEDLQSTHTITITADGGEGRLVDVALDCYVQCQAVLVSIGL